MASVCFLKHHANHKVQRTLFQILVSQTEESFLTRIGFISRSGMGIWVGLFGFFFFSFIWLLVFISLKLIFAGLGLCLSKWDGVQVFSQCSAPHRNHWEISWAPAEEIIGWNHCRSVRKLKVDPAVVPVPSFQTRSNVKIKYIGYETAFMCPDSREELGYICGIH